MVRRRAELQKAPGRRGIGQRRTKRNVDSLIVEKTEAKLVKRNGQSHAARLDIRFLQGPVAEKSLVLLFNGKLAKRRNLVGCKEAVSDVNRGSSGAYVFRVDPQRRPG